MQQFFRFFTVGGAEEFFVYFFDRRVFMGFSDGHIFVAFKNSLYARFPHEPIHGLRLPSPANTPIRTSHHFDKIIMIPAGFDLFEQFSGISDLVNNGNL